MKINYVLLSADLVHMVKTEARYKTISAILAIELFDLASRVKTVHDTDYFLKRVPKSWSFQCDKIIKQARA